MPALIANVVVVGLGERSEITFRRVENQTDRTLAPLQRFRLDFAVARQNGINSRPGVRPIAVVYSQTVTVQIRAVTRFDEPDLGRRLMRRGDLGAFALGVCDRLHYPLRFSAAKSDDADGPCADKQPAQREGEPPMADHSQPTAQQPKNELFAPGSSPQFRLLPAEARADTQSPIDRGADRPKLEEPAVLLRHDCAGTNVSQAFDWIGNLGAVVRNRAGGGPMRPSQ